MHVWGAVDLMIYLAKKILVTQYQPRAMTFVLAWYNLISLISHCLLNISKVTVHCSQNFSFLEIRIQNGDLKTLFHCSSLTFHRAAEKAMDFLTEKYLPAGGGGVAVKIIWTHLINIASLLFFSRQNISLCQLQDCVSIPALQICLKQ